ncbi:MAG: RNA polymerase sigma factor [Candidatus Muiribacteriota bacterium]
MNIKENEAEIVKKILEGDSSQFEKIMDIYSKRLYSFLYRMCLNEALAEDILQQAFIKAYRYLNKWDNSRGLKNWLYMIARNCFYDYVKKEKKINFVSMHDLEFFLSADETGPEKEAMNREEVREVVKKIYTLKPKYAEILILRYIEDLSYEEISQILQLPLGTVKIRIHRAREKLIQAIPEKRGEKYD